MDEISTSDKEKISQLREQVGAHLLDKHPSFNTDFDMLRWLQGYDFNIDAIVPHLRRHLLLRKAWKLDTIVDDYKPPNLIAERSLYCGVVSTPPDVEDYAAISIDCIGRVDCDGLDRSIALMPTLKHYAWMCELNMRYIRKRERLTGKQSRIICVVDLDGAHIDAGSLSFAAGRYKAFCRFIIANYVEMIKTFVAVNGSAPLYYVYNYLMVPFLPAKTREKAVILGSNWKEEILKYVDVRALPPQWGGTQMNGKVIIPEHVPPELYWNRNDEARYTEEMRTLSIPAGKCASIYLRVKEGDALEWIVFCESAYIFSIEYVRKNVEENGSIHIGNRAEAVAEEVFPPVEIAGCKWLPEDNAFRCEADGMYVVCFRNSQWFGRITLRCAILVNDRKLCCFVK